MTCRYHAQSLYRIWNLDVSLTFNQCHSDFQSECEKAIVTFIPAFATLPLLIGSFGSEDFQFGAEVRFVTLEEKTVFHKVQIRSGGIAKQRVPDGMVHMEARSPVGQILRIKVWVFREPSAAKLHQDQNGPVELEVIHGRHDIEKVHINSCFLCSRLSVKCPLAFPTIVVLFCDPSGLRQFDNYQTGQT